MIVFKVGRRIFRSILQGVDSNPSYVWITKRDTSTENKTVELI